MKVRETGLFGRVAGIAMPISLASRGNPTGRQIGLQLPALLREN